MAHSATIARLIVRSAFSDIAWINFLRAEKYWTRPPCPRPCAGVTLPSAAERFVIEASPELRLTPRPSGEPLRLENLARPIDGRWPSHALPRTPLSRLVHPAQQAVAQRLRAMTHTGLSDHLAFAPAVAARGP